MPEQGLKEKTIAGLVWAAIQKFGSSILSFIANLVLARLLIPEDFGCIGMLSVFIAISETLIDGGFGSALIQRKKPTQTDYSTIFYWNLFVSVCLFVLLQICAPLISHFYKITLLEDVLRIQSIVIIINAFSAIPTNILTKRLQFKKLAKFNLLSTALGVVAAIIAALLGLGVWSLVAKALVTAVILALCLWLSNTWRPTREFSLTSLKSLFSFGGLMLLSSVVQTVYDNIQSLIIGRVYSSKDLGFYTQAKKVEEMPSSTLSVVVNQVTFPVFSQISDEKSRLRDSLRKNVICVTYLNFPLMILLILIGKPLFLFLFTDKWAEAIPYFQVLCLYSMLITINAVNTNIIKARGKSGLFFWLQLTKRLIGLICIVIGMRFGIIGMTWGVVVSAYIWWAIGAFFSGREIEYGILQQLKDTYKHYLLSIATGGFIYYVTSLFSLPSLPMLIVQTIMFVVVFLLASKILRLEGYDLYKDIIINNIINRWK